MELELVMTTERPRLSHGNAKRAREIVALLAGRTLTIEQVAAECGISRAAAARDMYRLRAEMGVEVCCMGEADENNGRHGPYLYTVRLPAGRVCAQDGCGTVLSRRNPSDRCALHGGWRWEP